MDEFEKSRRENALPLAELQNLVTRVVGAAIPDRLVSWLGVSKRNSERWLDGSSTFPPAVVEKLQQLAPIADELILDLDALVADYVRDGMSENLVRLRLREYSKTLSDEPPPRPIPPEPKRD